MKFPGDGRIETEAGKDHLVMEVWAAIQEEIMVGEIFSPPHIICQMKVVVVGPMDLEIKVHFQIRAIMVVVEVELLRTVVNIETNKKSILFVSTMS